MRGFCVFLLSAFCIQPAAAGLPSCDKAVRFSAAWFADPEVDNTKSSSEVTSIGTAASGKGTQIGHVVVETRLAVVPQESCTGVIVTLGFSKPVLRIANEIPPGTCAYARVMNHEQMHVRIHRDIARQFRELDYPWSKGATAASILSYAQLELDRLMQAQVRFDSPQEYGKNLTVCDGEIARLIKPVASPATARKPA